MKKTLNFAILATVLAVGVVAAVNFANHYALAMTMMPGNQTGGKMMSSNTTNSTMKGNMTSGMMKGNETSSMMKGNMTTTPPMMPKK